MNELIIYTFFWFEFEQKTTVAFDRICLNFGAYQVALAGGFLPMAGDVSDAVLPSEH